MNISAPVLVYERPRFTDAMFQKAKDSPIDKEEKQKKEKEIEDPEKPQSPHLLRRLSSRARSMSSSRRQSVRSDITHSKRESVRKRLSRRLSGLLSRSTSDSFATEKKDDDIIVFVDETSDSSN